MDIANTNCLGKPTTHWLPPLQAVFPGSDVQCSPSLPQLLLLVGSPPACRLQDSLDEQLLSEDQGEQVLTPSIVRRKLSESLNDPSSHISKHLANWDPACPQSTVSNTATAAADDSAANLGCHSRSMAAVTPIPMHPAYILLQYCMQDLSKVLLTPASIAQLPACSAEAIALLELDGLALLPMADNSLAMLSIILNCPGSGGSNSQSVAVGLGQQHVLARQLLFLKDADEAQLLSGPHAQVLRGLYLSPNLSPVMGMLVQQLVNTGVPAECICYG